MIDIDYGLYSSTRRIHLGHGQASGRRSSRATAGHSIGRWEGDTLVVDTVGFAHGVLVPPTRNSDKLHVVERFTLDTETFALKREYTAEDPVYLAAPYTRSGHGAPLRDAVREAAVRGAHVRVFERWRSVNALLISRTVAFG